VRIPEASDEKGALDFFFGQAIWRYPPVAFQNPASAGATSIVVKRCCHSVLSKRVRSCQTFSFASPCGTERGIRRTRRAGIAVVRGGPLQQCGWCEPGRRSSGCRESATLSKVSSTFGLSSASMAASDIEPWGRSSSSSPSGGSPGSSSPGAALGLVRNGVAARGRGRRRDRLRLGHGPGGSAVSALGRRQWRALGVGPRIGRFEIDDVAQEHLAVVEFVAPDDPAVLREAQRHDDGRRPIGADDLSSNTLKGGRLLAQITRREGSRPRFLACGYFTTTREQLICGRE
jgi:hypothetical protein